MEILRHKLLSVSSLIAYQLFLKLFKKIMSSNTFMQIFLIIYKHTSNYL